MGKWRRWAQAHEQSQAGALSAKADASHNHAGVYAEVSAISAAIAAHEATAIHGPVFWDSITDKPAAFPPDTHAHETLYAPLVHAHGELAGLLHTHAGVYEPASANIQAHIAQAHAPANAQKNSDITKAEIEARLTGVIATHSHASGSGPTVKSGLVNLGAGSTAPVVFVTPFPVGTTPHVVVSSCFNGSDTSTTLFAHTITNAGFTLKGAGNAAGNVAWIATNAGNT